MDILELMKQRHSVRSYSDRIIEQDKREILNTLIAEINEKQNLNIQIFYDEPDCFNNFMSHYGKFTNVKNYICLVGPKGNDEFLGYYGEQIVLKAQEIGLNTCWVALTHGKSKAIVGHGEKQVCLISLGYGTTRGVDHKVKNASEVSNVSDKTPQWFRQAIDATLLAPTAMNQQKYKIIYHDDQNIEYQSGSGFYTKLDLGIVKYHFDCVRNK